MKLKTTLAAIAVTSVLFMQSAMAQVSPFQGDFTFEQQTSVCDLYAELAGQIVIHRNTSDNILELLEVTQEDMYSTMLVRRAYSKAKLDTKNEIMDMAFLETNRTRKECYSHRSKSRNML